MLNLKSPLAVLPAATCMRKLAILNATLVPEGCFAVSVFRLTNEPLANSLLRSVNVDGR